MKPDLLPCEGGPLDGQRMPERWAGVARTARRPALTFEALTTCEVAADGLPVFMAFDEHRYAPYFVRDDSRPSGCRVVAFRYAGPAKP